jgi:hypothetical protein
MMMPMTSDRRIIHQYKAGNHFVDICTDLKSVGLIEYTHMAIVYAELGQPPVFFVTAEVNTNIAGQPNPESHFLCTFDEERHTNFGAMSDIADFDVFEKKALNIINRKYAPHLPQYEV